MSKTNEVRAEKLSRELGISKTRAREAVVKAEITVTLAKEIKRRKWTHQHVAQLSGLPRSSVTGILSGSLQKVTIDRLLRLADSVGFKAEIRLRRAV